MDALPTRASFELAAKISVISRAEDPRGLMDSSIELLEAMVSVPAYLQLVDSCHNALHHCPLIQGCDARRQALASIMSQIFAAGWAAGRQEIIDGELAKMTAAEKPGLPSAADLEAIAEEERVKRATEGGGV